MDSNNTSRREFLKKSAVAITALPILATVAATPCAFAQPAPTAPLDPESPVAKALGYSHDSTKVDAAKFPKHQAGQACHACNFFSAGGQKIAGQEGEWGKCTIFPMGLVNSNGWCNSFVPKPAA